MLANVTTGTRPVFRLLQIDASDTVYKAVSDSSPVELSEQEIFLTGKIHPEWKIVQPLAVTIEHSDDLFIASDEIFGIYGDGDSIQNALEDYKLSLIDYFQILEASIPKDEHDQNLFDHLKLYVVHIRT